MNTSEKEAVYEEIARLKKGLSELENKLNKKEQWEPKGGGWSISGNGSLRAAESYERYRLFGTEYSIEEQAEKARDMMRLHNILVKYRMEYAPDYKEDWNNRSALKWRLMYSHITGAAFCEYDQSIQALGDVYFPEPIARQLTADINEGRADIILNAFKKVNGG